MSAYPVQEVGVEVKQSENSVSEDQLPPFALSPSDGVDESRRKKAKRESGSSKGDAGCYGIRVVTGKMVDAGVKSCRVFVSLIGTKGSTGKVPLIGIRECLMDKNALDKNTHQDLIIKTSATLGDIQVVILGIDGKSALDNTWFVRYTMVYDFSGHGKKGVEFPCYHWIKPDQTVTTTATATTPQDVANNPILQQERENQLTHRKLQYQWQFFPESGLPSAIDDTVGDLPADEEFSKCKDTDFTEAGQRGFIALRDASTLTLNTLGDYLALSEHLEQHELFMHAAGRWTSDVEFGRQILNGVNPVIIEKCTCLPANFLVTSTMVGPFLTRGLTLEQEMEAGRIYICNMKIMDGLPPRDGQFVAAPICLLYVNCTQQLVPIAIQLKQGLREEEKKVPNPIFFPNDGWIDWLLAKTYYQSAHGQFHQISTHYQSCHAAMEAYAMATMRNLPDAHPVNKLLRPHFRYTMAINMRARATLINTDGIIDLTFGVGGAGKDMLFKRATTVYSVDWTNIKKSIKQRGVDNPDQLPGYHYRDDGLKIFDAFEEFVRDGVNAFYACDKDVESDHEIQAWANDIHTNAFPGYFGGTTGHGFPSVITTKDELIERCTVIIFTGSTQHSSINFGQYTYYGFVPNAPFTMRQPPPTEKGADYQKLLDSLPDKNTAKASMNITYTLSQYSSDEVYLGDYPYMRFTESKIQRYIERLQKKLEGISGEIEVRNKSLDVPYEYMLPKNVTNSITI